MTWKATVLTLFPEMFPGPLGFSLAGKALTEGTWQLDAIDIRDFAQDRHRSVDDTPAGGGAGIPRLGERRRAALPVPLVQHLAHVVFRREGHAVDRQSRFVGTRGPRRHRTGFP